MFALHGLLDQRVKKFFLLCLVFSCLSSINPQWAGAVAPDQPYKKGGLKGFMERLLGIQSTSSTPTTSTSTSSLTFTAQQGSANPAAQTVSITNTGGGTLSWTASEPATWLNLNPTSGAITAGQSGVITVSVNIAGLTASTYSSTITISAPGSTNPTQQISAALTVSPPPPIIGMSPLSLSFTMVEGATNSGSQTLTITNTGTGSLSWTASETASWMSLNPTAGSLTAGQSNAVTVTANPTGLTSNVYTDAISLTSLGATPVQVPVTLAITTPSSGTATLTWDPETDPSVKGYKVYAGTSSGSYGAPVDVGNVTTFPIINLQSGKTYYFTVTAYNSAGESGYSNEVSKGIP